jgi:hypothetical protein
LTELVVGEKYKLGDYYEITIIAQSPITGEYIGEYDNTRRLDRFLSDGRLIGNMGTVTGEKLIKKVIEVEYEFWVNFYKDGTTGQTYKSLENSQMFSNERDFIETRKFTHKATYTE